MIAIEQVIKQLSSQEMHFYCLPPLAEAVDNRALYCSPTKIPNRDKKTESPYLVHPLTYRQVYLTKDAYFVKKLYCELVEMA